VLGRNLFGETLDVYFSSASSRSHQQKSIKEKKKKAQQVRFIYESIACGDSRREMMLWILLRSKN
jgi:hypothetical protein